MGFFKWLVGSSNPNRPLNKKIHIDTHLLKKFSCDAKTKLKLEGIENLILHELEELNSLEHIQEPRKKINVLIKANKNLRGCASNLKSLSNSIEELRAYSNFISQVETACSEIESERMRIVTLMNENPISRRAA